jgi:hypothetical protein
MKRERPAAETTGQEIDTATALSTDSLPKPVESVAVQLRRRRAASWRLPPLASGHRDPLDDRRAS